ncbi:hypothetical protein ACIQCG_14855 [Streptomyces noursei]|uniref:hypothetical protein n=1 Tax=Streptomyces noursei TaxID=1971 RepID=UPI0038290231
MTGWIGWEWIIPAVVALWIGVALSIRKVPVDQHRDFRVSAVLLGVVSVLVALLAFGVLSAWFWVLPALGWLVAVSTTVDTTKQDGKGAAR